MEEAKGAVREDVVHHLGGGLSHTPGITGGTGPACPAREGYQKVVATIGAPGSSEAVGQDAAALLQPLLEEWMADEHFRKRGMLAEIEDPEVGPYAFARTVPHLSAASEIPLEPSPALGGHTRAVLEGILGSLPPVRSPVSGSTRTAWTRAGAAAGASTDGEKPFSRPPFPRPTLLSH
jgi:hypothetical protein